MADVALAPEPEAPATLPVPDAARGTLTVSDRVVQRVATVAAARVPGVASASAGGLLGRDLPHTSARVVGTRAQVEVDVALVWPAPAAPTARAVRDAVAVAVARYAGVRTDHVDVRVVAVADQSDAPRERVR